MYDNYFHIVDTFSIIIYTRLSKEEIGKSKEEQSKSIKNQIEICRRYIEDEEKNYPNCKFQIIAILKDDGISGTTFDRTDFKKLLQLIEEKKANMVITTDLSRLGRNHVKTDDFLEEWFPEHNVRYVSIVESVDTYADCVSNDIAPIINWSNEHFAKLTSKKIKGRFQLLRKEGKWTGGEPPFGYKIDKENPYHFVVDEESAEIVKRIFSLFLSNHTIFEIANILTNENVPIPTVMKGIRRNLNTELKELWKEETIKNILTNEMYLGYMIQGKTTRLNHKSKKIIYLPKEQWVRVKGTHEAIIDEKTFQMAQLLFQGTKNQTKKSYDYLLKGLLKCNECGRSIGIQHFQNRKNNYTICNYYRKYGRRKNVCSAHRFLYEKIEEIILNRISEDCLKYVNYEALVKKIENRQRMGLLKKDLNQKMKACQNEIGKIQEQIDAIYEDKLNGIIDEKQYKRVSSSKLNTLQYLENKLNRFRKEKMKLENENIEKNYLKIIENFLSLKDPSKVFISSIIHEIKIAEDGTINIYYNVCNPKGE
jgi:DNA invertase Pin-like site-specific DNA recombinase